MRAFLVFPLCWFCYWTGHLASLLVHRWERRWQERMDRYGAPYLHSVVSPEDGHYVVHQVESAVPTPQGLRVIITRGPSKGSTE